MKKLAKTIKNFDENSRDRRRYQRPFSIQNNKIYSNLQIAQIRKSTVGSGLGISLEGTVDVENGKEVRPHHYIRSILPEGPVGVSGILRSADELLEVIANETYQIFILKISFISLCLFVPYQYMLILFNNLNFCYNYNFLINIFSTMVLD